MTSTKNTIAIGTLFLFALAGVAGAQTRATAEPAATQPASSAEKAQTAQSSNPNPTSATPEIAAPAQPQRRGGDPGGGGQGRQTLATVVLADLSLVSAFQLGSATIPWGTSATVSSGDASSNKRGLCGFRYKYVTRNQGGAAAIATTNRIRRDTQNGQIVASNALAALAPGATAVSDGHLWLQPGTWMLYVHADEPQAVAETDEANNLRRVKVTVEGKCG
ncbi:MULTISPECIES: CARDB domain-containing protein [unclassified Pseudoxanthomonas]|uniref:CARDB domain-containing protein n=1 Tax=unclassified Pseudoxanthomonas TaxID=2645906 RepID=UPI003076A103